MARSGKPTAAGELVSVGLADMAHACRHAKARIDIASPFLSADVAAYLVRACNEGRARDRRFITALNAAAVEGGYLDLEGIEELLVGGFEVRSLRNLHAKILIADQTWGLMGSGNLTVAGANGGNAELGIVLDPEQARAAGIEHFNRWWNAALPLDVKWMRSLKRRAPSSATRRRREGRGGFFATRSSVDLSGFSTSKIGSGYWLKIMYGSKERMTARYWEQRMWVSDRHTERPGGKPKGEPTYKIGEHLVIYVSRGERNACPAVMRVVERPVFDPDLVAREAGQDDAKQWGWVTWVEPIASIALSRAPTLADIGVSPQSVRQHGHIRLDRHQYHRALSQIRGW